MTFTEVACVRKNISNWTVKIFYSEIYRNPCLSLSKLKTVVFDRFSVATDFIDVRCFAPCLIFEVPRKAQSCEPGVLLLFYRQGRAVEEAVISWRSASGCAAHGLWK